MKLRKARMVLLAMLAGAMPLGTVSTCDYSDGYGSFFYDQGGDFHPGFHSSPGYDVIVEDVYYEEEIIYEDVYYDDCGFWDGCHWDDWWW